MKSPECFLETYDASAPECDFQLPQFDDSAWIPATINQKADHTLVLQTSKQLVFEETSPKIIKKSELLFHFRQSALYYP